MPALAFIFITVVLDMLALGVVIPVLPKLIVAFEGGDTSRAAQMVGLFGTVWAFMQFICSPIMGALSDRFGRRPVILLSNFGLGLDYVLMALAPTLSWLFVGRVISGVTAATISTSGAYIADVTPPEKRAGAFGLLGTAFGVGFILGPALGGVLGAIDPRMPFWVSAALSFANGCYGLFVLPESLPPERRVPFVWRRATPVGAVGLLRSKPGLADLAMIHFLRVLAHVALPSTAVLYVTYRYGWDERAVGLNLAAIGVGSMIVQGGLVRPVVARFGEARALVVGLLFGVAAFLVYGLAPTGALFWWGVPLMALWGLSGPSTQGLMTGLVDASEQGRLQGATGSLAGIAEMIGPGMFTAAFAVGIGRERTVEFPGAAFCLAAAMLLLALVVARRATR
jgi:DHA1 family tetracycline resistance protein-like MFS transporter